MASTAVLKFWSDIYNVQAFTHLQAQTIISP